MKYGFIGCGNMGGAIASALSKATKDIMISDPSPKARELAAALGVAYGTNEEVIQNCDRVFLAVKPQMMEKVLTPLQGAFAEHKPTVITIAAGLEMATVANMLGTPLPMIRIMPNTPVFVGQGMIVYCHNGQLKEGLLEDFLSDMQYCGKLDAIDEKLIDVASALSGSGPAYMYMLLEALADGAVACGLPRQAAYDYAAATMAGSAQMVLQSGKHPGALKDDVCSPGGSTIAGVRILEERGFRSAAMDCICAAFQKNKELGKK